MKTIMTLAVAVLLSTTAARAEVVTKGGASGLLKAPPVRDAKPVAAMNCATCKSTFVTVNAPVFKGSTPTAATLERHACTSCGNKWVTSGVGKTKVEVAKHTCGGCTI